MLNESHRQLCTELLKKELIPALGCTEPIAVAYAAARCRALLSEQLEMNLAIAQEGIENGYGAQIGRTLLQTMPQEDIRVRAVAYAAAGSDARMSGCVLPVVINSGSGNQGITVSVPRAVYARQEQKSDEQLYRALAFSNLLALYQKTFIGKLSAYCGAISAACACVAGIAFLNDEPMEVIEKTIVNTLGGVAGVLCDGAKPSCAAKIAAGLQSGLQGYEMAKRGFCFRDGEGLVMQTADQTIRAFGYVGKVGMRQTDSTILRLMVGETQI